jgi:AcrR family transcriptional regulator
MLTKEEIIRDEVITTAQRLFQRYGFSKTTMEDIAKAMGRGKSTLYYYYKSKDDIFKDVIIQETNEVMNAVLDVCEKEGTAQEKLFNYISTLLNTIRTKVSLYEVMKKEFMEEGSACMHQPSLNEALLRFDEKQKTLLKSILLFGVQNKDFSERIIDDIELIAEVINISLGGFILDFTLLPKKAPFDFKEEKVKTMINVLVHGLKN